MASEDEDDLEALRNAVLATMKNPPKVVKTADDIIQTENKTLYKQLPYQDLNAPPLIQQAYQNAPLPSNKPAWGPKFSSGQYRGQKGFNRGKWAGNQGRGRAQGGFSNNRSSNLILIPLAGQDSGEPRKNDLPDKRIFNDSKPVMLRPQDKWAGTSDDNVSGSSTPTNQSRSAAPGRFRRFDSDSDSDDEDSDNEIEEKNSSSKIEASSDEEFLDKSKEKEVESDDSDSDSKSQASDNPKTSDSDSEQEKKDITTVDGESEKLRSPPKQSGQINDSETEQSGQINESDTAPESSKEVSVDSESKSASDREDSDKENSDKSSENKLLESDNEMTVNHNVSSDQLNCSAKNKSDSEDSESSSSESDNEDGIRHKFSNRRGSDSSSSHSLKLSTAFQHSSSLSSKNNSHLERHSVHSSDMERDREISRTSKQTLPINAHEHKMMEARRKKFENSSIVKVSDDKKTISLKGIVPRTKSREKAKVSDKPLDKKSLKRTRSPSKSESKPKHDKSKLKEDETKKLQSKSDGQVTRDKKNLKIKPKRKVSIESKESKSASSVSDFSDLEESDSDSNTWRSKAQSNVGRQPEDIERERRRRFPAKNTEDVILNRNARHFYPKTPLHEERNARSHQTYKRKQFFEEEPEEISSSKTRRGISSIVRSDTESRQSARDYQSIRVKVGATSSLESRLGSKRDKKRVIVEEVDTDKKEPLVFARTDARCLMNTRKEVERPSSPAVTLSYDSDDIASQPKEKPKRSVHERLGMQITTTEAVVEKKEKLEDSDEHSYKAKKRHKRERKTSTDNIETFRGDHEGALDKRIRTIQERNAAILRRQEEVRQDKKRFG